ncbi:ubiquinone biosynthesis hydrox [Polychaeton citri CBS 116435]|uniref:Ubiquinone biosynthesis monooxygenase COQ6, mitochondrial n=1 Tax=Polychaeton citri CBS 116435 TaxID=1314669 RepID=A0A9P4UL43_9PEZI|nr:ubiquinone biosynthesis hydrox [Polychaeton citri CBS 116435]
MAPRLSNVGSKKLLELPPALRRTLFSASTQGTGGRSPELFDVVCVGGGPAGLSFVNALRSNPSTQSLKIALVDSQDITTSRTLTTPDLYSNRCSSLTPSSVRFLHETGVADLLDHGRTQPYQAMDVWDGVSGSKIHFDPIDTTDSSFSGVANMIPGSRWQQSRREYEGEDQGVVARMCENGNLTGALLERLNDLKGVELLDKTKVESIDLGPEAEKNSNTPDLSLWPVVSLPNNRKLVARLLVGADGANSPVRTFADIPSHGWDYGRHGTVATLTLDREFTVGEIRTAYQRFLPTGPIALLPLPGNRASLVWSNTIPNAAKLKSLPPSDFTAMVNAAFRLLHFDIEYMLSSQMPSGGQAEEAAWREQNTDSNALGLPRSFPRVVEVQEGSVASFPLRMRHADTYTGHRVALLGDAAHTVHPLAGQGLNLGLADAESLASCLVKGAETGMDIGSSWCLDEYNSQRWAANNAMLGIVDKLHKLYSAGSGPVVWGRSLGLDLVDKLGPLKGVLMGAASGR